MRIALPALLLALLSACATYNADGVAALNRGDLNEAERYFQAGADRGDPMSYNNLGVVYERRGFTSAAVNMYTLAARHGVPLAQQNLARLGYPVPQADLAEQKARIDAQNARSAAAAVQMMQPPAPPLAPLQPPVNCVSRADAYGNVRTVCQ